MSEGVSKLGQTIVMHHMGDGMLSPCGLGFTTEWSVVDCRDCLTHNPDKPKPREGMNEYGLPIYKAGTEVSKIGHFDRGQKLVFHCTEHPDQVWASKDPYVSNWFPATRETTELCEHGITLTTYVLTHDYSPTRNG